MSLASAEWVLAQTKRIPGLRVVHFSEQAWDDHQDCIACARDDSLNQSAPRIKASARLKDSLRETKWRIRERFPILLTLREHLPRR